MKTTHSQTRERTQSSQLRWKRALKWVHIQRAAMSYVKQSNETNKITDRSSQSIVRIRLECCPNRSSLSATMFAIMSFAPAVLAACHAWKYSTNFCANIEKNRLKLLPAYHTNIQSLSISRVHSVLCRLTDDFRSICYT